MIRLNLKPYFLFSCLILVTLSAALHAARIPSAPKLDAAGYLLVDMHSDQVLAEKNADQRLEPASLTKIMTAHVVFQELQQGALNLSDQVIVSEKAWKTPGSRMFIEVNTKVSVEDLLRGLVIQSGNDAAVALAEHIAGSEQAFANMMNEKAFQLGMNDSHFMNSTGLPDANHYTTPRDIIKATKAMIHRFPAYYSLYSEKEFTYNNIRQYNRNNLLWRDNSVDGVKTGHTEAAGYCLVASAKRESMRLISVVMGARSEKTRLQETQSLLNYGFRFYETHRLYEGRRALVSARVWQGEKENLSLGLAEDLYVTIPRGQYNKLQARSQLNPENVAPIIQGQPLGDMLVELDGEAISQVPLIALDDMPEGGLWRKFVDMILINLWSKANVTGLSEW